MKELSVMKNKKYSNQGFTLLEMMIVVGVIAILAAIAIPNYTNYLKRAQRTDAMETLTEVMNQQQRFFSRNRTYTTDLQDLGYNAATVDSDNANYNIAAEICAVGQPLTRCVKLTASDQNSQEGDGDITLDSRGERTWNNLDGWDHK